MARYLMTHSLLASWIYAMKDNPYEDATTERDPMAEFMQTLRREPTPTSDAMQNGIDFENLVTNIIEGKTHVPCEAIDVEMNSSIVIPEPITDHPWYKPAKQIADTIAGGVLQYKARKNVAICGMDLLLYGRLDALKAGVVYDIKFSKHYDVGKFVDSTQHPMYLRILPEAYKFVYLVSNGSTVWTETYRRDETLPIEPIVADFLNWLSANGLMDLYKKHWETL